MKEVFDLFQNQFPPSKIAFTKDLTYPLPMKQSTTSQIKTIAKVKYTIELSPMFNPLNIYRRCRCESFRYYLYALYLLFSVITSETGTMKK